MKPCAPGKRRRGRRAVLVVRGDDQHRNHPRDLSPELGGATPLAFRIGHSPFRMEKHSTPFDASLNILNRQSCLIQNLLLRTSQWRVKRPRPIRALTFHNPLPNLSRHRSGTSHSVHSLSCFLSAVKQKHEAKFEVITTALSPDEPFDGSTKTYSTV